jgi:hypothetical protein
MLSTLAQQLSVRALPLLLALLVSLAASDDDSPMYSWFLQKPLLQLQTEHVTLHLRRHECQRMPKMSRPSTQVIRVSFHSHHRWQSFGVDDDVLAL